MKFDKDPEIPRIVSIAILMFIEALLVPVYAIVQTGSFPTPIQWFTFFIGAILQVTTMLMLFVKGEPKET